MGGGGGADTDLYAVLGLSRECTDADLRLAYRKLAMIWHPDRCSAARRASTRPRSGSRRSRAPTPCSPTPTSGSSTTSASNDGNNDDDGGDDDDEADLSGMGDFLGEMAQMMNQATPTESFEELQQLFVDLFHDDIDAGLCRSTMPPSWPFPSSPPPPATTGARSPAAASRKGVNKRCSPAMDSGLGGLGISGFCFKAPWMSQDASTAGGGGKRRKHKPPAASHGV